MKLTVLIDNTTLIDQYYISEPGLSLYLEADGKKILFDTGFSGAFLPNAEQMQIPLHDLDYVVLSHGHSDHTWGLPNLIRHMTLKRISGMPVSIPDLVTHPLTFSSRSMPDLPEVGSLISEERASRHFHIRLSREPVWLTENLVFLGEIDRRHDFEQANPNNRKILFMDGREEQDYLLDDSALAYRTAEGLVIITGCSHAGICNIIDQASRICDDTRIVDIVGGLHLLTTREEQIRKTVEFLKIIRPRVLHACHCTSLTAKHALAHDLALAETGVGLTLVY
ncbi:MAG: MBL fold metallo-hydrolase [Methanoregulaceae archaeon]